jgi:LmbE family N-acetylglucosaminyl deacetylase
MRRAADVHAAMRALPIAPDLDTITGTRTAMILAPHPDDESLGCGGLIAEACARGRPPAVVIVSDGTGSHPLSRDYPPWRLRGLREAEARRAVAELGLPPARIAFLGLRDTAVPRRGLGFELAIDRLVRTIRRHDCGTIFAPWVHDPHGDHVATHLMAQRAAAESGATLFSYPVWGWTLAPGAMIDCPAISGWRLDISAHMDAKARAIKAHESQVSGIVEDDPSGFRLSEDVLSHFLGHTEVFLRQ